MATAMIITAAIGVGTSLYSANEARKTKKQQDQVAGQQYDQDMSQVREEDRRAKLSDEQSLSRARALAGASGAAFKGSTKGYISEMAKNFSTARDWNVRAGQSNATNRRRGANIAARSGRNRQYAQSASSVGSAIGSYGGFAASQGPPVK